MAGSTRNKGIVSLARMLSEGGRERGLAACHSVDDVRQIARRRVPRAIYDFVEGGADDEVTLRANRTDFERITFVPNVLVDTGERRTATRVGGTEIAFPLVLGPAGMARLVHPHGELAVARAAGEMGTIYTVSIMSSYSLEEVAQVARGTLWLQLYPWRSREFVESLVDRAKRAGYSALVLTVDTPTIGHRERDLRNGMTMPPRVTVRNSVEALRRPRWLRDLLFGPPLGYKNLSGVAEGDRATAHSAYINEHLANLRVTWADLEWLRQAWDKPIFIKGVMDASDARRAADYGLDGVIVSNHGGRQMDSLPSSVRVLAEIADAVGDRVEVLLDGGVRRGSDIVKAMALGARAVTTARCWVWGLAAGGEAGVTRVLRLLWEELDRDLILLGRSDVQSLDRSLLRLPPSW